MYDLDEIKINNAVHECLDRCYRSDVFLATIATFIKELNAAGWQQSEVSMVELAVHNILQGVVVPNEPAGHGTRHDREATTVDE